MFTAKPFSLSSSTSATGYLQSWRNLHPLWCYSTLGYLALMLLCLIAQGFDDRLLYGISVWAKPFKFAISLAVYFGTMVVFVKYMPQGYFATTRGRILTTIPFIAGLFEMGYITAQAALGEPSHFNRETSFHATMYSLMGMGAVSMVAILFWMGVSIARNNPLTNPLILAIVIGLMLTFVLGGGFGTYLGNHPGHWVGGANTDANGILLFKWARDGGDLRVAHFFGMHAMQVMPIFALLLPKAMPRPLGLASVVAFATAYSAFSWYTFSQAIQGQPFIN